MSSNELFKGFGFDLEDNKVPVAVVLPPEQEVVVGAVAKLDGRSSIDPDNTGLTYQWSFSQVPIGSQVEISGFTNLESDASIVSFAPDITGSYQVQLVVSDGSLDSDPTTALVDVRVILVPHHQGIIPDASFIWNYLSDFWTQVPDKRRFETYWSSAIQTTASAMLKLYQYQYNKSIRDIQELIQKRWIAFSPALLLDRDKVTFIVADDLAGLSASTFVTNPTTGLPAASQPTYSNVVTVPLTEGDFVSTAYGSAIGSGRLLQLGQRSYTLSRANNIFQSLNYASDGSTTGTDAFHGSGFTNDMVGATLRILGPASSPVKGDYTITVVSGDADITIEDPPSGVTWAGRTGLEYSVLPAEASTSSFFADQAQVPTRLANQAWRLSSTLISSEYDLEAQGVSVGDLLEVEVTRVGLQTISTFYAQIVSVDRGRAGFVLNLEDLVDGTPATGLTQDIQVTLASDLIVPGISAAADGSLVYGLDALEAYDTITSIAFKRTYYDKELTTTEEIDVGPFSVQVRPVQIVRNRKIAVDDATVSIPILQEYVKQPDVARDAGKLYLVTEGGKTEVSRIPYLLSENLDYLIDDESTITGACSLQVGVEEITIPHGDLIDRSVQEGDTLEVSIGVTTETYTVLQVVAADILRVTPTPVLSSSAALFTLTRRIPGKFLRFIDGVFSKTSPAPTRLWSEVTYFDNGDAIEGNFGVLVGVRREDLAKVGSGIPYKSAVAGLMYALSNGPTISNITLSAQILLGLPFTQNAGVIKQIDPDFKKREDGSPSFGRVLVDGRDRFDNPTGITNIYFYPQGRQLFDTPTNSWVPAVPEFSGIATNPDTGVAYAVGDVVSQFTPLSKGVEIQEYLTNASWIDSLVAQGDVASMLQKYHSFQVLVNADLITSTDIDLVAQFLKKVKAHYVRLTTGLLRSLEDLLDVTDLLLFGRVLSFYETPCLGLPTSTKLDEDDEDRALLSVDGVFYTRYLTGTDLVTDQATNEVTSAAGGFLQARAELLESWDPPLLRAGDLLVIQESGNSGTYVVTDVPDDTTLVVDLDGGVFETAVDQKFIAYRPLRNPIWTGRVSITTGDGDVATQETVGTAAGIGSAGVAVGDLLVFADLESLNPQMSQVYTVIDVVPDLVNPYLTIIPDPIELTGQYDAWVVREGLLADGVVTPATSAGETIYVNGTVFSSLINFLDVGAHINSWPNISLIQPGDLVVIDSVPYNVLRLDRDLRRVVVSPPLLASYSDKEATLVLRPGRPASSVDLLERAPEDLLDLTIASSLTTGDAAQTTSGSADVVLTVETFSGLSVVPGDYLLLYEGLDSARDVGNGLGVFPIKEILGGTTARLLDQLTDTGVFRYGIRRKLPNEG